MPLKESHGNMYDRVSHVHTHLAGECQHKCSYCYVGRTRQGRPEKYQGPPRLLEKEFQVNYGSGKVIFIEHMNDLFGPGIPNVWIDRIFSHCCTYPQNEYVFQTKNPSRAEIFIESFPPKVMLGITIETNREIPISKAPSPTDRFLSMAFFSSRKYKTFITIEPIMDFDVVPFVGWIKRIRPTFINIGADSKGCNLPEPSPLKVRQLIDLISMAGIEIRKKINLKRLGVF